ncbi:valine--tRNA ligase-like [Centruroides sculpturatus]|uniref:valine--tRNA ligase-like n=1 Tax=Centruroides sculpturatus TaxID=218467 RepID=UPI000C6E30BB|nr:valine--tRNA ligase-like [Centruroides sculpturatus]
MPDSYSVPYVEAAWYAWWEKMGFFKPEYKRNLKEQNHKGKFVIVIPPPNVTGNLHLGHALTSAIEDAVTRWNRMKGKTTLWNPGCDHAGIATQVVVEKKVWREQKKTRHDLGREKFIEEIWKWKKEKGDNIYKQLKLMGCSVDWDRATFTMDPKMCKAVTEAFVRLHEIGLIYRSNRLVNWSCALRSAISDIEVDKLELSGRTLLSVPGMKEKVEFGVLISFAYKIENSSEEIVVATTRIETMLGDTAVAVHPDDQRYKHLHGKFVIHPFCNRRMPIVCDKFVDPNFGTGAVKITPAHDHNDYEVGKRHNLPFINILDDGGIITNNCGQFTGLKRFEARKAVLKALEDIGLYRDCKDNPMVVPICNRSKDIVEPLLKVQWFLNCNDMAQKAAQAVRNGSLKIIPEMHEKTWYHWLENIRDWCISRQLWWGHRIPAYFVTVDDPFISQGTKMCKAVTEAFVRLHEIGLIYRSNRLVNWSCALRSAISDIEAVRNGSLKIIPEMHEKTWYHWLENIRDWCISRQLWWGHRIPAYFVTVDDPFISQGTEQDNEYWISGRTEEEALEKAAKKFKVSKNKIKLKQDDDVLDTWFSSGLFPFSIFGWPDEVDKLELSGRTLLSVPGMKEKVEFGVLISFAYKIENSSEEIVVATTRIETMLGDTAVAVHPDDQRYKHLHGKFVIHPFCNRRMPIVCDKFVDPNFGTGAVKITPAHDHNDYEVGKRHNLPFINILDDGGIITNNCGQFTGLKRFEARKAVLKALEDIGLYRDCKDNPMVVPICNRSKDIVEPLLKVQWFLNCNDMAQKAAQVFLHSIIRDAHGRKMSKSLGNVIDPTDVIYGIPLEGLHKKLLDSNLDPNEIEKAKKGQKADFPNGIPECGTDALRFALCAYMLQGRDINLDINRVVGYRKFCNKLWNATKFALTSLGDNFKPLQHLQLTGDEQPIDKWILSRLSAAVEMCNRAFEEYDFPLATTASYNFWLYELCDVYLECLKSIFQSNNETAIYTSKQVLYTCVETGLKLLSPFMPYVTEELFQRMPRRTMDAPPSICVTSYPEVDEYLRSEDNELKSVLETFENLIKVLTYSSKIEIINEDVKIPEGCVPILISNKCEANLLLKGTVDFAKEIERLEQKKEKLQSQLVKSKTLYSSSDYESKVPEEIKAANIEKIAEMEEEIKKITNAINTLQIMN